jgi:hypothetical protein
MNNKAKQLIQMYEVIIYGNGFDYAYPEDEEGWDERFEVLELFRKELATEEIIKDIWNDIESALSNQIHIRNADLMKSIEEEITDYSKAYESHEDYNYIVGGVYRLYEKRFNNQ